VGASIRYSAEDDEACEILGISKIPWSANENADLVGKDGERLVVGIDDGFGDACWKNAGDLVLCARAPLLLRQLLKSEHELERYCGLGDKKLVGLVLENRVIINEVIGALKKVKKTEKKNG